MAPRPSDLAGFRHAYAYARSLLTLACNDTDKDGAYTVLDGLPRNLFDADPDDARDLAERCIRAAAWLHAEWNVGIGDLDSGRTSGMARLACAASYRLDSAAQALASLADALDAAPVAVVGGAS